MEKIDFVVTWVDGNDPAWRAERAKYMPAELNSGNAENRYRDWDLMRYWFRGIEKFAPWVNKVFFVTWGHVPDWLDLSHPKLVHVKHEDYIPAEYLPTFNSIVIENNLHLIPELSEKFVLFNDDVFLIDHVSQNDFFKNGLPCETALLGQLSALTPDDSIFPHMLLNNIAIINKHFSKRDVIRNHWKKFFSVVYGKELLRNALLLPARYFSCFYDQHVTSSYLKQTFRDVWETEPGCLQKGSSGRFRSKEDVSHWLMKAWQICKGQFVPRAPKWGMCFEIGRAPEMIDSIQNRRCKVVCLNDSSTDIDFEQQKQDLQIAFDSILPDKCSFEL